MKILKRQKFSESSFEKNKTFFECNFFISINKQKNTKINDKLSQSISEIITIFIFKPCFLVYIFH
jgi:hypothetical protein